MTQSDDARTENRALRERISTLNGAILRISASLDLDTVLAEAVESARGLAGARYGAVVRTLINATPIPAEGAGIRAVMVTMQDMAPFDEIERMRTEFLGLVSHELRAPLTSITGSAVALLEDGPRLHPAEMREFHRIIVESAASS